MKRLLDASLKRLNSFSVEARAGQLVVLESEQDLQEFSEEFNYDHTSDLILGGGSNVLFAGDVTGTVILNRIAGKKVIRDSDEEVIVEVHSGENWHQLVLWSLQQGLSGIENLSLIPGLAGAAPMQNIGAYGVELADTLDSVQAFDLEDGRLCEFSRKDCHLEYRDSRFRSSDAGRYLITRIRLRLQRQFIASLSYSGLSEELHAMGVTTPTAKLVSDAVIRIRQRKLPDPAIVGNAGSFFKNPVVTQQTADSMKKKFSDLPVYPANHKQSKLSAAWLIESCGWKGQRLGRAAVSEQHALVLVNRGQATGREILELAEAIRESVKTRFDIELQAEPRIIGA
jgi:UDP-N-acetylmuramate dehydrogenase